MTTGWTNANLQKLLAAMKTIIPKEDRGQAYTRGLKAMDWKTVAFPPFSPEACQKKWGEILQKVGHSLTLSFSLTKNNVCSEAFNHIAQYTSADGGGKLS